MKPIIKVIFSIILILAFVPMIVIMVELYKLQVDPNYAFDPIMYLSLLFYSILTFTSYGIIKVEDKKLSIILYIITAIVLFLNYGIGIISILGFAGCILGLYEEINKKNS